MKKWFGYGVSFLGLYLFFVISTLPAQFALGFVDVPKDISLTRVSGTLWNTKVEQVEYKEVILTKVEAYVDFWSFFTLDPSIDLAFGSALTAGPEGKLTISGVLSELTIHDADILVSANEIVQRLPLPIEVVARNDVQLLVDKFVLGKPICEVANGTIKWQKASMQAMNETVVLGDLSALFTCEKGALALTIDPKNDLGVNLVVTVRDNGIKGQGDLLPGAKFPKPLKAALPFLGQPDNKGRYRLSF
jgi:general secretion pathway protein N